MRKFYSLTIAIISVLSLLSSCKNDDSKDSSQPISGPIFTDLPSNESGISFSNLIKEDVKNNHLIWSHIYSGAGVGVGDINNDGLMDIYFSGNLVDDALYLNKGNMKFEDITASAGIVGKKGWSTGVTFGDVNSDGYNDIYVCRLGSSLNPEDRQNLLYINNGNNTFTEQAALYGVNDGGFSIQSTFFDMDKDGDLDLFVANQPPDPRLISRFKLEPENNKGKYLDKMYRNTGDGKFIEISKAVGLDGFGYGLNVVASDINGDGWTDLYESNDYDSPDFLYINNGDLTFTNTINESIKHISNFAMGSDIADYDNDGLIDIAVVDMASADHIRSKTNMGSMSPSTFWQYVEDGKHYQYMFNTLQRNNGNGTFSELGQIAGISKTDWSWSVLMADFDNDQFKDMAITNGIQRDIRNNDFQYKIKEANKRGQKQFDIMDVVNMVPSNPLPNYIFKNNGDFTFSDVSHNWGFDKPGFSHGMAYADFDLDGDLDCVINNMSSPVSMYENVQGNKNNYIRFKLNGTPGNQNGYNAKVKIITADGDQIVEITSTRGFMSASEPIAHFGLGDLTKVLRVEIIWPSGDISVLENPAINKQHKVDIKTATKKSIEKENYKSIFTASDIINHLHEENNYDDFEKEILIPHKQSENGPFISVGDVNNNGMSDLFIGGAAGYSGTLYLKNKSGEYLKSTSQPWSKDKQYEDLGSVFFDADGDKDLDIYITSGGNEFDAGHTNYQDRLYLNNGKGNFTKSSLPKITTSTQAVIAGDYDNDGDQDLFVGGRLVPGQYPAAADSYLLINDKGKFKDKTDELAPDLRKLGLVTDAIFTDYDGDEDLDLMIVGEWMPIKVFSNNENKFTDVSVNVGLDHTTSWWWTIESGDFDNDGDQDYALGNLGKNTKFKASDKKPFMVYSNDFDQNGTNDIVLANYYGDKIVPVRGRQCSSEQMPFIAEKFPSFEGFATASLDNILPADKMESAVKHEINSFKSVFLINNNGHFEKKDMPIQAQFAPLRDMIILDADRDGQLDILGVGNMYGAEVETMRYDAGIGLFLRGNGQGEFVHVPVTQSGFFAPHDAHSITLLDSSTLSFVVGNNKENVQSFKINL